MFLLGSFLIFLMNLIRIFILIDVLVKSQEVFPLMHDLFWSILASIYVVLIWIFLIYVFNIKTIPIYSDVKTLVNEIKK